MVTVNRVCLITVRNNNIPAEFDAPSSVEMHDSGVVLPRNTKGNGPLGLCHGQEGALVELSLFRVGKERLKRQRHFFDRLQEGRLMRVLFPEITEQVETRCTFVTGCCAQIAYDIG
jgi:hypothetical protein